MLVGDLSSKKRSTIWPVDSHMRRILHYVRRLELVSTSDVDVSFVRPDWNAAEETKTDMNRTDKHDL